MYDSNEKNKIFLGLLTQTMYYAKQNDEYSRILIKVREILEGKNGYIEALNYMNNYCDLMQNKENEFDNVIKICR